MGYIRQGPMRERESTNTRAHRRRAGGIKGMSTVTLRVDNGSATKTGSPRAPRRSNVEPPQRRSLDSFGFGRTHPRLKPSHLGATVGTADQSERATGHAAPELISQGPRAQWADEPRGSAGATGWAMGSCAAPACNWRPSASTTLRIVSKPGLRSPERAL